MTEPKRPYASCNIGQVNELLGEKGSCPQHRQRVLGFPFHAVLTLLGDKSQLLRIEALREAQDEGQQHRKVGLRGRAAGVAGP